MFVFFDPMGQALCKRTLNIVEKLSEKCGDKLLFYLSKADEAGRETDRQVRLSSIRFFIKAFVCTPKKVKEWFISAEGDDADSPGAVSPSRSQQMWF